MAEVEVGDGLPVWYKHNAYSMHALRPHKRKHIFSGSSRSDNLQKISGNTTIHPPTHTAAVVIRDSVLLIVQASSIF